MDCDTCAGKDPACVDCEGRGYHLINSCPRKNLSSDVIRLMEFADFAKHGVMPLSGGMLDQTDSFVRACRYVWTRLAPNLDE